MPTIKDDTTLIYLVGFSSTDDPNPLVDIDSDEVIVETLDVGEVRCWLRRIDADIFQGPDAESNLTDLEWLTPRVLLHETVVSHIAAEMPFLPTRFGTLFSSEEALTDSVSASKSEIVNFLSFLGRRREWGLKVFVDRNQLERQLLSKHGGSNPDSTRGANYLREKKLKRDLLQRQEESVEAFLTSIEDRAASAGINLVRRTFSLSAQEHGDLEMVASFALLMHEGQMLPWIETTERLRRESEYQTAFHIESTGPWAAYSFCPQLDT
jgi:hypothetical protein